MLTIPTEQVWENETGSDPPDPLASQDLTPLIALRHRMIGAFIRQERTHANMFIRHLSAETGIAQSRLKAYELGERTVSVPELESILTVMGSRIENFFDQSGPVGEWMTAQLAMQKFMDLPKDFQEFVCQPVNRPYLELAMKLSSMSRDKLRSVAEGLLDITL